MALQQLASDLEWPLIPAPITSPYTPATAALVDAGHYVSWIFQARQAMTISHVGWQTGLTVTGSPTADTRIETVDPATGFPSGTLWGGVAANIVSGTLTASTFLVHALTAAATIAVGDIFAVKMAHVTGTNFVVQASGNLQSAIQLPYRVTDITGTLVKIGLGNQCPILVLGNSATTFYYTRGCFPATAASVSSTFSNVSSAARGVKFRVPFKCRCVGIWAHINAAVGDFNIIMLDGSSTATSVELGATSTFIEGDKTSGTNQGKALFYFDTPIVLFSGVDYRAVIEPTTTVVTNLMTIAVGANYLVPCSGAQDFVYTSRSGTTWTDSATTLPVMGLLIDQLEDGPRVVGG